MGGVFGQLSFSLNSNHTTQPNSSADSTADDNSNAHQFQPVADMEGKSMGCFESSSSLHYGAYKQGTVKLACSVCTAFSIYSQFHGGSTGST